MNFFKFRGLGVILGIISILMLVSGTGGDTDLQLAMPALFTGVTAVTSKKNVKIEELVSAIDILNDTEVTTEEITVELKAADGSFEVLIPGLPLKLLFEYAAQGEGLFHKKLGTAINSQKTRGRILLSPDGGLELGEKQYLNVSLASLDAARTYQLNTVQDEMVGEEILKWEKDALNADQGTRIVSDKETLVLPVTNFTKVDLIHEPDSNGESRTVTFELDDLITEALNVNDVVCIDHPAAEDIEVRGYLDHFFVDLEGVQQIRLYAAATGYQFYTVAFFG